MTLSNPNDRRKLYEEMLTRFLLRRKACYLDYGIDRATGEWLKRNITQEVNRTE